MYMDLTGNLQFSHFHLFIYSNLTEIRRDIRHRVFILQLPTPRDAPIFAFLDAFTRAIPPETMQLWLHSTKKVLPMKSLDSCCFLLYFLTS